ncbi:MAG: hypothetical protein GX221_06560 [Candidatus Riflebacteria bacterium]|nr:hypothetical protein [Candidatus Riflebacteria bacterium]
MLDNIQNVTNRIDVIKTNLSNRLPVMNRMVSSDFSQENKNSKTIFDNQLLGAIEMGSKHIRNLRAALNNLVAETCIKTGLEPDEVRQLIHQFTAIDKADPFLINLKKSAPRQLRNAIKLVKIE